MPNRGNLGWAGNGRWRERRSLVASRVWKLGRVGGRGSYRDNWGVGISTYGTRAMRLIPQSILTGRKQGAIGPISKRWATLYIAKTPAITGGGHRPAP